MITWYRKSLTESQQCTIFNNRRQVSTFAGSYKGNNMGCWTDCGL